MRCAAKRRVGAAEDRRRARLDERMASRITIYRERRGTLQDRPSMVPAPHNPATQTSAGGLDVGETVEATEIARRRA